MDGLTKEIILSAIESHLGSEKMEEMISQIKKVIDGMPDNTVLIFTKFGENGAGLISTNKEEAKIDFGSKKPNIFYLNDFVD